VISLDAGCVPAITAEEAAALERLRPAERGYWLDHELVEASALPSVALLVKARTVGWVQPDFVPIPGGGRRRVWTLREVAYAELLVRFSEVSLVPLQSAAALLVHVGRDWIDLAVRLEEQLAAAAGRTTVTRPAAGARLVFLNMTDLWAEKADGDFVEMVGGATLVGPDNYYKVVEHAQELVTALSRVSPRSSLAELLDRSVFTALVAMDRINISSIGLAKETRMMAEIVDRRTR
jgi:hypothetical protein